MPVAGATPLEPYRLMAYAIRDDSLFSLQWLASRGRTELHPLPKGYELEDAKGGAVIETRQGSLPIHPLLLNVAQRAIQECQCASDRQRPIKADTIRPRSTPFDSNGAVTEAITQGLRFGRDDQFADVEALDSSSRNRVIFTNVRTENLARAALESLLIITHGLPRLGASYIGL